MVQEKDGKSATDQSAEPKVIKKPVVVLQMKFEELRVLNFRSEMQILKMDCF